MSSVSKKHSSPAAAASAAKEKKKKKGTKVGALNLSRYIPKLLSKGDRHERLRKEGRTNWDLSSKADAALAKVAEQLQPYIHSECQRVLRQCGKVTFKDEQAKLVVAALSDTAKEALDAETWCDQRLADLVA
jgi:hypothetical protein